MSKLIVTQFAGHCRCTLCSTLAQDIQVHLAMEESLEEVLAEVQAKYGDRVQTHSIDELWHPGSCHPDVILRLEIARLIINGEQHLKCGKKLDALLTKDTPPKGELISQSPDELGSSLRDFLPHGEWPQIVKDYLDDYRKFYESLQK